MQKIIDAINIYPHPISFTHNKKSLFYSIYGILVSMVTYIVILYLSYYFSTDLINYKNPKLKIIQSSSNENMTITLDKIIEEIKIYGMISFNCKSPKCEDRDYIENDLFNGTNILKIFITNTEKTGTNSVALKDIYPTIKYIPNPPNMKGIHNHNLKFVFSMTNETFLDASFVNIPPKTVNNAKDVDIFIKNANLKITYEFKTNESKEIKNFLINTIIFNIKFRDNTIDSDDLNYYHLLSKNLTPSINKRINMFYKIIQFKNDENRFLTNFTNEYIPQIDYYYFSSVTPLIKENYYNVHLLDIEFRDIIEIHSRTYKKYLDVLSEIGGILNPMFMIGQFLVMNLNEKKFKINILNKLFTDEDITREIKKSQKQNHTNEILSKKRMNLGKHSLYLNDDIFNHHKLRNKQNKHKSQVFLNDTITSKKVENFSNFLNSNVKNKMLNDTNRSLIKEDQITKDNITNFNNQPVIVLQHKANFPSCKNEVSGQGIEMSFSNIGVKNDDNLDDKSSIITKSNLKQKEENIETKNKPEKFIHFEEINFDDSLNENEIKEKINSYLYLAKTRKQKLLKYNFVDFTLSIMCCKKLLHKKLFEKEEILKKIYNKVDFYFEITNLMRLYENFEKMKFVLFNKNQIDCFNYMIYDVNINKEYDEKEILFELSKYFRENNNLLIEKYFDDSFKILMRNEIKNLIIKK